MNDSGCSAPGCRLGGTHAAHWDGATFTPNEAYVPPRSRHRPGRARADRVSPRAREIMEQARANAAPDERTTRSAQDWTKDQWVDYALEVMGDFLATRTEPFTTPEHLWPLLLSPPGGDKRVMQVPVSRALRVGVIREVAAKRLKDDYTTADGVVFELNKIVPIYAVVRA